MTVQTVPYVLQNASHSAALFRQSASAAFTAAGVLGSTELGVRQQASPNMSVILGAGRAKVAGTAVSPPSGFTWTTQAMYDVLNDADLTLTIAASNPTNPRIDAVYVGVQDSFYSGASNQALAGVVSGTPAASPVPPAVPANSYLVALVAVGANVTTIVTANITSQTSVARTLQPSGSKRTLGEVYIPKASQTTLNTGAMQDVAGATITATSSGGKVRVTAHFLTENSGSGATRQAQWQVLCDGVVMVEASDQVNVMLNGGSYEFRDTFWTQATTPAAGTHTWKLQASCPIGNAIVIAQTTLLVEEYA